MKHCASGQAAWVCLLARPHDPIFAKTQFSKIWIYLVRSANVRAWGMPAVEGCRWQVESEMDSGFEEVERVGKTGGL